MSDQEPIPFSKPGLPPQGARIGAGRSAASQPAPSSPATVAPISNLTAASAPSIVRFDRQELSAILNVYGRNVSAGLWRDYAIDLLRDRAVFSVFRKSTEFPLYRIEKVPKLARKQGAYSVIAAGGLILKRGSDLNRVISVLDKRIGLASSG